MTDARTADGGREVIVNRATTARIDSVVARNGVDPADLVAEAVTSMLTAVRASSDTFNAHWYPEDPYFVDPGAYRRDMASQFETQPPTDEMSGDEILTVRIDETTARRILYIRQYIGWWDDVRVVAESVARWTSSR